MGIEDEPQSANQSPLNQTETEVVDTDLPAVTQEEMTEEIRPIVDETNSVAAQNNVPETLDKDVYSQKVFEQKETPNSIQRLHELGLFKDSNNWKEIWKKTQEFSKTAQKEMVYLQILGGLGAVAVLEPTPLGELAFGVALTVVGKKSKVLKGILGEEGIEKLGKSKVSSGVASALKRK
jgi:hypothetical protein